MRNRKNFFAANRKHSLLGMVGLDIDGTIADHDGRVSPAVVEAVRVLVDCNFAIVLVTGRPWFEIQEVSSALNLQSGTVLCSNGAVKYDLGESRVLGHHHFPVAQVLPVIRENFPSAAVAVERVSGGYYVSTEFPPGQFVQWQDLRSDVFLHQQNTPQVVLREFDADLEEFRRRTENMRIDGVETWVGNSTWLDIGPKGITKASALEEHAKHLQIDRRDVLVVGDGHNDIDMLRWAGVGVAMGQSEDAVKQSADMTTASITEEGAARAMMQWLSTRLP